MRTDAVTGWKLTVSIFVLAAVATACGQRHESRGLVLKVDERASSVTVSHEPIPGVMDAMVMPFTVANAAELRDVRPGDRIQFRLRIGGSATTIDRVKILSAAAPKPDPSTPGAPAAIAIGAAVPSFTLVDQHGATVSLDGLRGKIVVVSFIYTRCPLPDFCPRVMTNFTTLRDRFADRLGHDLVLLTITLDPQYDTVERLREYGERYGANIAGWHLLTGTRDETTHAASLLGVESYPEEGMLTHTLQTAVIARDGRLAARAEGREFTTRQLGDLVDASR